MDVCFRAVVAAVAGETWRRVRLSHMAGQPDGGSGRAGRARVIRQPIARGRVPGRTGRIGVIGLGLSILELSLIVVSISIHRLITSIERLAGSRQPRRI